MTARDDRAERGLGRSRRRLARVQLPRPPRGARRADAAPRAREVPRDLLVEPRRVLHEADRAHPPDAGRQQPRRPGAARAASAEAGDDRLDARARSALLQRGAAARARRSRRSSPRLGELSGEQHDEVSAYFDTEISPVLTPLGLDAAHPFPYVSNLSTSWAFRLLDPVTSESVLVRVKVPRELRQWVRVRIGVESPARVFVALDEVIAANADRLFPGMESRVRACSGSAGTPRSSSRRAMSTARANVHSSSES